MTTGRLLLECCNKVEEVVQWLDEHGFRLRRANVIFTSVMKNLLCRINAEGLHASTARIKAILNAPTYTRQSQSTKITTLSHKFIFCIALKLFYIVFNCRAH